MSFALWTIPGVIFVAFMSIGVVRGVSGFSPVNSASSSIAARLALSALGTILGKGFSFFGLSGT